MRFQEEHVTNTESSLINLDDVIVVGPFLSAHYIAEKRWNYSGLLMDQTVEWFYLAWLQLSLG